MLWSSLFKGFVPDNSSIELKSSLVYFGLVQPMWRGTELFPAKMPSDKPRFKLQINMPLIHF